MQNGRFKWTVRIPRDPRPKIQFDFWGKGHGRITYTGLKSHGANKSIANHKQVSVSLLFPIASIGYAAAN